MLPGHGTVNSALEWIGLVDSNNPITFFYHSRFAIGLVLAYSWIPFVALPIFVVLDNMDVRLLEAATSSLSQQGRLVPLAVPTVS